MRRRLHSLFPPSELIIPLKRSRDYQLLLFFVYTFAIILVWLTHWPVALTGLLACLLSACAYVGIREGRPHTHCVQWVWRDELWQVYHVNGQVSIFTAMCVRYDLGFVLRMELSNREGRKSFLVFHDQLSLTERRALYFLQLGTA